MDTKPLTYKQYCLNKALVPPRRNTALDPTRALDPDNLDDHEPIIINRDYKNRTILNRHDKYEWATDITKSTILDRITNGILSTWRTGSTIIKRIVSSRKTVTTTDIHLTDR